MRLFRHVLLLLLLPGLQAVAPARASEREWPCGPDELTVYVSPSGNDAWSGRFAEPNHGGTDGPFQHFERARLFVESLDKTRLKRITVSFRGGTYPLSHAIRMTSADSGSPHTEIAYAAFPGETPVFTGGIRVTGWVNISGNEWQARLPAGTGVFEDLYVNGERRLRPRVGGYLGQYFRTFKTVYVDDEQDPGCPHQAPKDDRHYPKYECFDRFEYDPDPAAANNPYADPWTNLVPADGNLCPHQNAGEQKLQGEIEVLVFEQFSTSKLPVSCVDADKHIVYLTAPTATPGGTHASESGFIEGNRYLVENVKNALTEPGQWYLDRESLVLTYLAKRGEDPNRDLVIAPQLDRLLVATDLAYVTFRGLVFEYDNYVLPFPTGHVSTELEADIGAAVSFQNSSHVVFDGGTVRHVGGTALDFIGCIAAADPDNQPEPECVAPGDGDLVAVVGNAVTNSAFYDVGALGVRIGGPYLATDQDWNVPQKTVVENNVVEGYGRTVPAAFGIGQGFGHHNLYTHNDVYDGYHCAISVTENDGGVQPNGMGGAYNVISFNHVWNLLQGILNDGGSIRVEDGNDAHVAEGNRILNNRIHDVTDASIMDSNGYGGHGIYLDNQSGLVDVENNLVYRVSGSTVYTPHGPAPLPPDYPNRANLIRNNILAYGRLGMVEEGNPYEYPVPTKPKQVSQNFVITNNLFFFDRNAASTSPFDGAQVAAPFYIDTGCTYTPFAYTLFQSWNSNLYWRTDGHLAGDQNTFNVQFMADNQGSGPCSRSREDASLFHFYTFDQWRTGVDEDLQGAVRDPRFVAPYYPRDDFRLEDHPGVGFVPFDLDDAGRYRFGPHLDAPRVPPTFTTMTYDPATDF